MSCKNVLMRFPIERLPDEDKNDFLDRAHIVRNEAIDKFLKDNPEYKDVDCNRSYIWDGPRQEEIQTQVVEILEIPIHIGLSYGELLVFHDCVKHKDDDCYTSDISPEEAMELLTTNLNELEKAIIKVRGLIDAKGN